MNKSLILSAIISMTVLLSGCGNPAWKANYRRQRTHTYEVISVDSYIKEETNRYGGVIDRSLCYVFSYMKDGNLCIEDEFDTEDIYNHVSIGEENKYVEYQGGGSYDGHLYLTEETLKSLKVGKKK